MPQTTTNAQNFQNKIFQSKRAAPVTSHQQKRHRPIKDSFSTTHQGFNASGFEMTSPVSGANIFSGGQRPFSMGGQGPMDIVSHQDSDDVL
jgi:hypothetical protein